MKNTKGHIFTKYSVQLVKEKSGIYPTPKKVSSPKDVYNAMLSVLKFDTVTEEIFAMAVLDTKNNISGIFTISHGTLNASLVHPREVFKRAILTNGHGIILVHNHPSGDPRPSQEDRLLTERLVESGKVLGIAVLDHVIIGDDDSECGWILPYYSFKEQGLL